MEQLNCGYVGPTCVCDGIDPILDGKYVGHRPLDRPQRRQEVNTYTDVPRTGYKKSPGSENITVFVSLCAKNVEQQLCSQMSRPSMMSRLIITSNDLCFTGQTNNRKLKM